MDTLIEELNSKLLHWQSDVVEQVRQYVAEIIEMADRDIISSDLEEFNKKF
jgi:hypothetical protein